MNRKISPSLRVPVYGILIFFAVVFLYPIVWLVLNSFKTQPELFSSPWGLPSEPTLDNYQRAFTEANLGRYFLNSVIVTGSVVVLSTLLSAMAAFGITRLRWKLSKVVLGLFLLGMTIPMHAAVVPLFDIFNRLDLVNHYPSVIIPHIVFTMPMAIMILVGFFENIPREVEEAAVIDGCSIFRVFWRIVCPMVVPSLVTVAVITFITSWNELLFPQVFLSDPDMMTLPVGLTAFQGRYSTDYVGMIAAVVITIIPTIIIYTLLHKKIVGGMTAGAVKG